MEADPHRHSLARALGDFWYWGAGPSHTDLERVFDAIDMTDRIEGSGKREKVEQAVTVASADELPRLLSALVELLHERGFLEEGDGNEQQISLLRRRLAPFGVGFDDRGVTGSGLVVDVARLEDASDLRDRVSRLQRAVDHDDAELILGSAKELLEATAKFVLRELDQSCPDRFPALLSEALRAIGLHAKQVDGDDDIAAATRRILGALNQIAVGVNDLRNEHGTGHGRAGPARFSSRHARLAAGSAVVLATIMVDTLEDPNAPWRRAREA